MKTLQDFQLILSEVHFRDWRFTVSEGYNHCVLVIEFDEPCNLTGEPMIQRSRKWLLSPHMTRSEVVQTAWLAVQTAMQHEMREQFRYRARAIFGPHFDVDALITICDANAVDVRESPPSQP